MRWFGDVIITIQLVVFFKDALFDFLVETEKQKDILKMMGVSSDAGVEDKSAPVIGTIVCVFRAVLDSFIEGSVILKKLLGHERIIWILIIR